MARFKLLIEYEGTRYSGWQMQKNAKTIQGTLLKVAEEIFKGEKVDIQGSGRTDSGVHALCQVAHLDVKTMLAPEIIRMKFNDKLPYDINVLDVIKTHDKFHARHDATSRSYIYQISRRRTAFGKSLVWWIRDELDIELMKKGAALFMGMQDFSSFTDEDPTEKSTKVLIEHIDIQLEDELILIKIRGSHFLWKMVRRMVGILVELGRKNIQEKDIVIMLHSKSDFAARFTAPPSGLFLEQVLYEKEQYDHSIIPILNVKKYVFNSKEKKKKIR